MLRELAYGRPNTTVCGVEVGTRKPAAVAWAINLCDETVANACKDQYCYCVTASLRTSSDGMPYVQSKLKPTAGDNLWIHPPEPNWWRAPVGACVTSAGC